MPTVAPFEALTDRYDEWFEANEAVYQSEVAAVDRLVPERGYGIEIGVGTGRFAAPLGIDVGIDPAVNMLEYARSRGIGVIRGVAEQLPFTDRTFDTALLVTTICFVDDVDRTVREAKRVLVSNGSLVIGFVDANSPLGRTYADRYATNPFYRDAVFITTEELVAALEVAGFSDITFVQTLFRPIAKIDGPEPVTDGYGDGSFIGIKATR